MSALMHPDSVSQNTVVGTQGVHVRSAIDSDSERWNAFVDAMPDGQLYHRYEWRRLFENVFGHTTHYLIAENDISEIVGVLPASEIASVLFGRFIVSLPYFNYCGVLARCDQSREALIATLSEVAESNQAAHIELRHRQVSDLGFPSRTDKVAMELELPTDADALWKQFSSKLRAQIRRPQKAGAICTAGGIELLDDFYCVFARNMRDLGTPVFPKAMFAEMLTAFPHETTVFIVSLDGEPAAAGITIGYRKTVEIPFASSLRQFNRQAVNMLLYWSVLESAIRNGYQKFDFGRSSVDSGPHRFKKQWGATPVPLSWHYLLRDGEELPQLNPSNPKFALATAIWRRLPVGVATLLGPKIVRYLA